MNPLGWQRAPERSLEQWDAYVAIAAAARRDGLTQTLVCGMGGSSLGPQVLGAAVLDSTNPAAVRATHAALDVPRTVFVITSKSGTTVETLAGYHYFAAHARPEQFIAITEPGTPLDGLARERRFRAVLPHPSDVGGRYSALTVVGMLPAALIGLDGPTLLERARRVDVDGAQALGRRIAEGGRGGRDKLVLDPPSRIAPLGQWIEQLVAESSGKGGRGVVPVVDDPHAARLPDAQHIGASEFSAAPLDLGREFLRWEYATVTLCDALGVNPFDQPNVDASKQFARAELETPRVKAMRALDTLTPSELLTRGRPGDYVALLAYVPPGAEVLAALQRARAAWGRALGCATTLGLGPRYLHSTGQLHKGGPNTGLFLVVTTEIEHDIEIPEMGLTFGELHRAQARGDILALLAAGRRVAHVHVAGADPRMLEQRLSPP